MIEISLASSSRATNIRAIQRNGVKVGEVFPGRGRQKRKWIVQINGIYYRGDTPVTTGGSTATKAATLADVLVKAAAALAVLDAAPPKISKPEPAPIRIIVSPDLRERLQDIREWRRTGSLPQCNLRQMAMMAPPRGFEDDPHSRIFRAERDTLYELMTIVLDSNAGASP